MDGSDGIVTVRCGARRWRLEGFEDAFAALGALAPWLGETAAGGGAEAPPWARAGSEGGEVVLRPAAAGTRSRGPGDEDDERDTGRDDPEARAGAASDAAEDAGLRMGDPSTAARGEPASDARLGADGWEEEMLARLSRTTPADDARPAPRPGAFAEIQDTVPEGPDLPDARAPAPFDPAREGMDVAADAAPPEALDAPLPGDGPAEGPDDFAGGPGEEMDRIVFRLAEATGGRPVAPEADDFRPPARRPHRAEPEEAAEVRSDARGRAGPDRARRDLDGPVTPRRPARPAGTGRAPRSPAEGAASRGVRPLPPLVLTEAHRVGTSGAPPPAGPVVPRRVVARGR